MKAITFESVGRVALSDRPEPRIEEPGDVIVRVTAAGICGSDLHIVDGHDIGTYSPLRCEQRGSCCRACD